MPKESHCLTCTGKINNLNKLKDEVWCHCVHPIPSDSLMEKYHIEEASNIFILHSKRAFLNPHDGHIEYHLLWMGEFATYDEAYNCIIENEKS